MTGIENSLYRVDQRTPLRFAILAVSVVGNPKKRNISIVENPQVSRNTHQ
jgi:hypothetical protein